MKNAFVSKISLLVLIRELKHTEIKRQVDARMREFRTAGAKPSNEIFKELCFCLMTANFNAERSIKIQKEIGNGFITLPEKKLAGRLKKLGHRYPNARAKYIVEARKHKDAIKKLLKFCTEEELRNWLVKNVKGLGYKEASHFLRNIGFCNCAIIDFHIIDVLARHKMIKRPKKLTPIKYLEIEAVLQKMAWKLDLNLAELDLYLWFLETGKVLK